MLLSLLIICPTRCSICSACMGLLLWRAGSLLLLLLLRLGCCFHPGRLAAVLEASVGCCCKPPLNSALPTEPSRGMLHSSVAANSPIDAVIVQFLLLLLVVVARFLLPTPKSAVAAAMPYVYLPCGNS